MPGSTHAVTSHRQSRSETSDSLPAPRDATIEEFGAAVERGQTVALLVTKDPGAAVVYYFWDARRAFEAHERLGKLNALPVVAYVSPGDGVHQPAARLRSASLLALRSVGRLARLITLAGPATRST